MAGQVDAGFGILEDEELVDWESSLDVNDDMDDCKEGRAGIMAES